MRIAIFAAALLLMIGAGAGAQTTPGTNTSTGATVRPAGTNAPTKEQLLDQYLQRWEREMKKVQTLSAAISRTDKDKTFGKTKKHSGFAYYMKSGSVAPTLNLALLELKEEGKAEISDKFICTGTYLYQFVPAQKEIRAYEMPKPKPGQVSDDSFLGFMFGMQATEAKKRYNLTLSNESKWYIYVDIVPRFPADRADFQRARLVLNRDTYLPRQLWFESANGSEVTWDIPRMQTGVAMDRRAFDAPRVPAGWKLVPVTKATNAGNPTPGNAGTKGNNPQPRIFRPNDNK